MTASGVAGGAVFSALSPADGVSGFLVSGAALGGASEEVGSMCALASFDALAADGFTEVLAGLGVGGVLLAASGFAVSRAGGGGGDCASETAAAAGLRRGSTG